MKSKKNKQCGVVLKITGKTTENNGEESKAKITKQWEEFTG